uniref:Uncharacterized protein n=1 Tax=Oryza brachyantha TaxID=4533 RepID=J3MDR1_ORYBR
LFFKTCHFRFFFSNLYYQIGNRSPISFFLSFTYVLLLSATLQFEDFKYAGSGSSYKLDGVSSQYK